MKETDRILERFNIVPWSTFCIFGIFVVTLKSNMQIGEYI